ncbi:hypothetical protein [Zobellella sp. An-6]|uniref:hypothetical protein n=1 Tax=Zobellella sp. An-6 TaxID=3400218 RepID=UPI0040438D02
MTTHIKTNKYGLPQAQTRPHIRASKRLDLSGEEGKQIVKSETRLTLKEHQNTFKRLADM